VTLASWIWQVGSVRCRRSRHVGALQSLKAGERLEDRCTDPLVVINIPNLIRETGDRVEIVDCRSWHFALIEKAGRRDDARQMGCPSAFAGCRN